MKLVWFLSYLAYHSCGGGSAWIAMDCSPGSYQARLTMPSHEICQQVAALNPNAGMECLAAEDKSGKP